MNMADDIANLLRRFGASADGYLEVETALDYTEPPIAVPVSAPVVVASSAPVDVPLAAVAAIAATAVTAVETPVDVAPVAAKLKAVPAALSIAAANAPRATQERIEPVISESLVVADAVNAEPVAMVSASASKPASKATPKAASKAASKTIPASATAPVSAPVTGIRSSLRSWLTYFPLAGLAYGLAANKQTPPPQTKPQVTPAQVIAVVSPKGGVGKSTISAALAGALSRNGRAIAIDLDPQNALQYHVGVNPDVVAAVNAGLVGEDWATGLLDGVAGTRVLPYGSTSEKDRRAFERDLEEGSHWLSEKLVDMHLDASDVVVIDTPPGRTLYLDQALDVADHVVVVITPDAGSFMVLDQIDSLLEGHADNCSYIVNQFDASRTFCQDMLKVLKRRLGAKLIGIVPLDHAISEGLALGELPLLEDSTSAAHQQVLAIVDALKLNVPAPVLEGSCAS
jgi:cellulose synthase operon protein YhjQ